MAINKDELEKLIAQAGVGSRTAKKLLSALEGDSPSASEEPTTRRGHGSATAPEVDLGSL